MVGYALEVDIPGKGAEPKVKKINNISQYQWLKESLEINDEKLASFKKSMESSMDRKVTGLSLSGYLSLAKYREYREFRDYLEMVGGPKTTLILNDAVALAPSEAELADIGSGPVRDIISQLLQYKKNEEPLPGDILNNLLRGDQLHLEDELNIKNEEIIDRALLKLYTYYSTAKQEPGVSK